MNLRAIGAVGAVAAMALVVSGCGSGSDEFATQKSTPPSAAPSLAQASGAAAVAVPQRKTFTTVRSAEGLLVASYARPTLQAFAADRFVTVIATGVVTRVRPFVGGGEVQTSVRIRTADGRVLTTREPGGRVLLSQVRADFAGHIPAARLKRHLDEWVDYVDADGPTHSRVGQQVLVMLGGRPSDPGGQFTVAEMVRSADGSYTWLNPPGNPGWTRSLSAADAAALDRLK